MLPFISLLPIAVIETDVLAAMQTRLARHFVQLQPLKILELPMPMPTLSIVAQYQAHQEFEVK